MDESLELPTAIGAKEGETLKRVRRLQFMSPGNTEDDSEQSSLFSLEEIDEGDNDYFCGFTAEALKMANSRALEAYETAPMATPAVEKEKKLNFVRLSFKVIRYQLRAERETLRRFEKEIRGQEMTEIMREERVNQMTNIDTTESLMEEFERLFQWLAPGDPFFSMGRVRRYDQPADERRDNEQRDFDEDFEQHLPPKRRYREEYYEKSKRAIDRAERAGYKAARSHEEKGERAHKRSRADPPSPEEEGEEEVSSLSSDEEAHDQAREEIGPEAQKMRAVYTVEQLGRLQPCITHKTLEEQWRAFKRPRPLAYTRDQFFEAMEKDTYQEVEDFFVQYEGEPLVRELLGNWRGRRWIKDLSVENFFKVFSRIWGTQIGDFLETTCKQKMDERAKAVFRNERADLNRVGMTRLRKLVDAFCKSFWLPTIEDLADESLIPPDTTQEERKHYRKIAGIIFRLLLANSEPTQSYKQVKIILRKWRSFRRFARGSCRDISETGSKCSASTLPRPATIYERLRDGASPTSAVQRRPTMISTRGLSLRRWRGRSAPKVSSRAAAVAAAGVDPHKQGKWSPSTPQPCNANCRMSQSEGSLASVVVTCTEGKKGSAECGVFTPTAPAVRCHSRCRNHTSGECSSRRKWDRCPRSIILWGG